MLLTLAVEPNAKRSRRMKRIEYGQDSGSLSHAPLIPVVVTKGVPCVLPPIAVGKILLCHQLNPGTWKNRAYKVLEVVGSLLGADSIPSWAEVPILQSRLRRFDASQHNSLPRKGDLLHGTAACKAAHTLIVLPTQRLYL